MYEKIKAKSTNAEAAHIIQKGIILLKVTHPECILWHLLP